MGGNRDLTTPTQAHLLYLERYQRFHETILTLLKTANGNGVTFYDVLGNGARRTQFTLSQAQLEEAIRRFTLSFELMAIDLDLSDWDLEFSALMRGEVKPFEVGPQHQREDICPDCGKDMAPRFHTTKKQIHYWKCLCGRTVWTKEV